MSTVYTHLASFGVCASRRWEAGPLAAVSKPHGAVGLVPTKNPQLHLEATGRAICGQTDQPLEGPAFWKIRPPPSTPGQAAVEAESVGTRQHLLWVTGGANLCLLENQQTGCTESFIAGVGVGGTMF